MSRDRRLIRLFSYDRISCQLFEKRFIPYASTFPH